MTRRALAALLLTGSLALAGGSQPASAQERNAITQQEAQIGAEQHEAVGAQFGGPYKDEKLQAYVSRVGERLKRVTPMAQEQFSFTLLDSDVVNAFAIPGGYVYVTRGLLALARDEAELAGVLGHEIGHVVAHHAAQRSQRAGAYSALGPVAQALGGLFGGWLAGEAGARFGSQLGAQGGSLAGTLFTQSYSREQESEADQLGIRFLEAAGYEPRAMTSFLTQLEANEALEQQITGHAAGTPSWLQDHPRTADRVLAASEAAAKATPKARDQNREQFMAAIDGMVYGDNPDQGIVRGRTFEHAELGFRFTAPQNFTLKNTPAAVLGSDGAGRFMKFDIVQSRTGDPVGYVSREWAPNAQVGDVQPLQAGSLAGATGTAKVEINGQPAQALLVAIEGTDNNMYRFLYADTKRLDRVDIADFEASATSLKMLTRGQAAAVRPLRVQVHTVRSGETAQTLAKLMAVEKLPLETFLVINGLKQNEPIEPGTPVKVVIQG